MDNFGHLQDALYDLNINVPEEEEEEEEEEERQLLPQWKDITEFLDEATSEFKDGQLVHLKSFTLFEAMSAIEIMDPRMDTGVIVSEQEPFDISRRMSAEETLDVMDNLVTREMAWLAGHSLSQTVYTCIYFHHMKSLNELSSSVVTSMNIEDIVYSALRIYVLATIKCCNYIWTEMTQGNVYEEEDFTTNLFGLSFNGQLPDVCILNDLDTSIMNLTRITEQQDKNSAAIQALLNRIKIRKSYLLSLIYLSQNEAPHLARAKTELSELAKLLNDVDLSPAREAKGAFDPNISRKLTSQTPPRPVELESKEKSYASFSQLIQRLLSICDVTDYPSVTSLMNFFDAFGSKTPYADAFSRSKLNTILFHNQRVFGTQSISYLILKSVEETVQPPPYWLTSNCKLPIGVNSDKLVQAHQILKTFLDRISMVFLELFRINCHNRSRQRRLLCKMVGEWQVLEEEAANIDETFQDLVPSEDNDLPYYFSSWAYHIKMTMIEKILFLGFELELYGKHEYTMILWYTRILLDSRNFLLERIDRFTVERSNFIRVQLYMNHATSLMTEALLRIAASIECTGQWNQRKPVFDDGFTRYLQRFKPFLNLASPPVPQYESYLATVELNDFDLGIMKAAVKDNLTQARKLLDEVLKTPDNELHIEMCSDYARENIKNMARSCVANNIGLNYMKYKGDELSLVSKYHPWFPVITK
ncbi:Mak10 subunit, NatC N-terminal acetyltransferase-domain-containing protein [Rhizopus microsporus]